MTIQFGIQLFGLYSDCCLILSAAFLLNTRSLRWHKPIVLLPPRAGGRLAATCLNAEVVAHSQ